uniref:Uncharacterized protein n=1 Tax=Oryzias latipes TaxID=8090 RepID=A0A3P9LQK0_ORYLA
MTDVKVSFEDFIASRRSGRRNAIHEIPTEKLQGSMDLSQRLAQLSISKSDSKNEEKHLSVFIFVRLLSIHSLSVF